MKTLFSAIFLSCIMSQVMAETIIEVPDSTPDQWGAGSFGPWSGQAGQIGQTFIVPETDHYLNTLSLALVNESTPFYFTVSVSKWNPMIGQPTGSTLYTSDNYLMPDARNDQTPTIFNFDMSDLNLDPDQEYVFFLNAKLPSNGDFEGSGFLRASEDNPYADGEAVYAYMSEDDIDTDNWNSWENFSNTDLDFEATFQNDTSVPLPSAAWGTCVLIACMFSIRRRVSRLPLR